MIPKGLITYTPGDIEKIAIATLRDRPDVPRSIPINVETLLEELPDLEIEYPYDLIVRYHVQGAVYKHFMSKDITVHVDRSLLRGPWSDFNATLGEEFSHITLHRACFYMVNSIEDFIELQRQDEWTMYERDAKRLSEALRMPADLLDTAAAGLYGHLVNQHGYGDPIKIERYMKAILANDFRVLPGEMQRRFTDWPCQLRHRVLKSALTASPILLPADWELSAQPPATQRPLFRDVFDERRRRV
jgi:hypothetical protein